MADRIEVSTEWLAGCAKRLKGVEASINSAFSAISGLHLSSSDGGDLSVSVHVGLSSTGESFSGSCARDDIRQLSASAKSLNGSVSRLSAAANSVARIFESAESEIANRVGGSSSQDAPNVFNGGGGPGGGMNAAVIRILGYSENTATWSKDMWEKYNEMVNTGQAFVDSQGRPVFITDGKAAILMPDGSIFVGESSWDKLSGKVYLSDGSYVSDTLEVEFGSEGKKTLIKRTPLGDENEPGYEGPGFDKAYFQVGAKRTATISAYHDEINYENGNYSSTTSISLMTTTATAGIYGGLYSVKYGPDGEEIKVLSPGIKAEIGVSVSALEISHTGRYGNDIAGIDYGVSTKAGSASLNASSELGIVDGHLAAHVSANAEIIGGEVGGEVGVDVLGVTGKVKGTLNYGIGAHADVGVVNGKISCDIGVSVGVGASLKFELDYGGALENIGKGISKGVEKAKKFISALPKLW